MTARICAAVVKAGDKFRHNMSDIAEDLRRNSRCLVWEDARYARALQQFELRQRENPEIFAGVDGNGEARRFTADQIRNGPIRDPEQNIVGVHFPIHPAEGTGSMTFTPEGWAAVHKDYFRAVLAPGGKKWIPGRRRYAAEWAKQNPEDPDPELVFSSGHGDEEGYGIQIDTRASGASDATWTTLFVDGRDFSRILASNKHFQQAARNKPTAQLIQFSCLTGSSRVATEMAQGLHSVGIRFRVWSPTDLHMVSPLKVRDETGGITIVDHGVAMKVDASGNPIAPAWAVSEASRGA
ncbi:hypothetical protein [Nocardia sp. NPDC051463]|uniref:hypothetical protein n=1 Tax=Nocardia sp. NPDC051463 TaxID=3154845 RepID=UPI00344E9E35